MPNEYTIIQTPRDGVKIIAGREKGARRAFHCKSVCYFKVGKFYDWHGVCSEVCRHAIANGYHARDVVSV